ncbi:MAG TPA: ABC transporter permease [Thermodesulfobacteriota bacterium]|nr:ABC transporter permease [Thermodesulfobacteriota bacterium]
MMSFRRTWAVFRKELLHIRRDPRSLILIILLPIMLLLIYGNALTFDIKHIPLAVCNWDPGSSSRDLIRDFQGSPYFNLRYPVSGYKELDPLITDRSARLALVLPEDFSATIKRGHTASLQAIVDGTEPNTANIVLGYTQAITFNYNQNLILSRLERLGLRGVEPPLQSDVRFWFNEELESIAFIVPGLIVVIMTLVGTLLTALTVVREVEGGSLESIMSTTLKRSELILGKLSPYFLICLLDLVIAMAMGQWAFHVPLRGNVLLLIGLSAIFLVVILSQGLLISVTAHNQTQAFQMAMLVTFLPALLLSGFVFSVRMMPWPLQIISSLVPGKYLVTVFKGIYLKGIGLGILWPEALMLLIFAVAFLSMAVWKSPKKLG